LPGESAEGFATEHQIAIDDLQPRNSTEHDLVFDIARARWMYERVFRAHAEHLKAKIEAAAQDEELEVQADLTMLWDATGQHQMYGLTSAAVDRPPAPGLGKEAEASKPPALVRKLEGSGRGCRALLDTWREMAVRVERGWEIQSHDRLKLTRMLGLNPIEVVNDQRVALIFLASFALHPEGKDHAYQDFKSEMGTLEAQGFVERIRSRWPLLLDCGNPRRAKEVITDL